MQVTIDSTVSGLAVAVVQATDVHIAPACSGLSAYAAEVTRRVSQEGLPGGDDRRAAVRQLLRYGGFKPSGRNKPAQEYLLRSVLAEGRLPSILNAVDLINAVSLDSGLPISLLAAARLGEKIQLRYGHQGERFVFNQAGQELDLNGLICCCSLTNDRSLPLGTPVKDSMRGKIAEGDRELLACIYVPQQAIQTAEARQGADGLADKFQRWCQAASCQVTLVPPRW